MINSNRAQNLIRASDARYSSSVLHQNDTFRLRIYIATYVYYKGRWPGVGPET